MSDSIFFFNDEKPNVETPRSVQKDQISTKDSVFSEFLHEVLNVNSQKELTPNQQKAFDSWNEGGKKSGVFIISVDYDQQLKSGETKIVDCKSFINSTTNTNFFVVGHYNNLSRNLLVDTKTLRGDRGTKIFVTIKNCNDTDIVIESNEPFAILCEVF